MKKSKAIDLLNTPKKVEFYKNNGEKREGLFRYNPDQPPQYDNKPVIGVFELVKGREQYRAINTDNIITIG